jgi:hypothetical protein
MHPLSAQQITGNIEGRIVDEQGEAILLVTVSVTGPDLQGSRAVLSSSNGYFFVPKLPVGAYIVKISHVSYQDVTYENIIVRLGKTTTMPEIRLKATLHEAPEIVVLEKRQLIDVTATTIGANLVPEEFDVLPIQRDYRELPALLPQANGSFYGDDVNMGGATGLENKHFIDGVDVTDPYRGTTGMRLPYNFIREVEVKTGSYQAEYRSSLGGILNVITHSGSNDFYGQVFGFYANNRFAADPRAGAYDPNTGDFSQYDIGFSIGGPISKDKLWFYGSYNPTMEREDVEIPGTGFHEDKSIQHLFAGKLTWKAGQRANVGLSVFGDPGRREGVGVIMGTAGTPVAFENPDPYLVDLKTGGVAASAYADWLASDKLFFESMISFSTRSDYFYGLTERGRNEWLFIDTLGVWSGGYVAPTDDYSTQGNIYIKGTYLIGNHAIKAGLEYKQLNTEVNELWRDITQFDETTYGSFYLDIKGTVGNRIPSVFLQDSWQVVSRLRLNAGVRWDGQFLVDSNGNIAQRITDQYAPRIGLIFQPVAGGRHKLYGSFARFYQDLSTAVSAVHHIEGAMIEIREYDFDPRPVPSGGNLLASLSGVIQDEVEDLRGQHYDEITLGYEMQFGNTFKAGVTGIYRSMREGIEDGYVASVDDWRFGNPGSGELSDYPKAKREYRGFVLTAERTGARHLNFIASYVLSENEGNYPGLFNSDFGIPFPNANGSFDFVESTVDSDGLLPNDRTHAFKFAGSYRIDIGLTIGTYLMWASGTPRSVFRGNFFPMIFAKPRGTDGRTPSIWDLNFRVAYDIGWVSEGRWQPRLLLDIFHVGSRREPVEFDQLESYDTDGLDLNPNFGLATRYQPPTAMRLGIEVAF